MARSLHVEIRINKLSATEREAMWQLYAPFYHYSRESFMDRIAGNTHYALYWRAGELVGFTGLRLQDMRIDGRLHFLVYFGQTVVAPEVRGQGLINRTGWLLFRRYWRSILTKKAYFWADALSYRAYLVFAKNLREYYPSVRQAMPPEVRQVRDYLGAQYYGDAFCAVTGTIRKPAYLIRDHRVRIEAVKLADADIRYFAEANPRHEEGRGLLTLAPMHLGNFLSVGWKVLRKALLCGGPVRSIRPDRSAKEERRARSSEWTPKTHPA
ncbi:MAG: hypothetical protein KDC54_07020 [Lewinella sp.]|nr:hypothetical protein [Lewinella sp.]